MSFEKKNNLGTISVSELIFASLVMSGAAYASGKVFLASESGKILGGISKKVSAAELASNMKIVEEENKFYLTFYVVLNFGDSISVISQEVLDFIEKEMRELFPKNSYKITFTLVGIRSKNIAERHMEIVREYEP